VQGRAAGGAVTRWLGTAGGPVDPRRGGSILASGEARSGPSLWSRSTTSGGPVDLRSSPLFGRPARALRPPHRGLLQTGPRRRRRPRRRATAERDPRHRAGGASTCAPSMDTL